MQGTRRQHVVSAFYLRGFAKDAKRLVCTPLSGANPYPIAVSDATVQNHFYSVSLPSGEVSDDFERAFSKLEGPASVALGKVLETAAAPQDGDHRTALATWIALQYLRTQGARRQGSEMNALMINLIVASSGKSRLRQHIERKEGAPISDARLDAEWQDLTRPDGPEIQADPVEHMSVIAELLPGTMALIRDSPWQIISFKRKALTTCDHPVALIPDPTSPQWSGTGLATAWGYSVPLGRHLGLVAMTSKAGEGLLDAEIPGTAMQAKTLNSSTINNSRNFLFHHPDDDPRAWFGGLPKPRAREMEPATDSYPENGWFGEERQATTPDLMRHGDGESSGEQEGFSLEGLAWPIPGRVFEWSEPS